MRKNKMMRIASALLVAVLLTTCAISGTFAKYVTKKTSNDVARVAKWGVEITAATDTMFDKEYYKKGSTTDLAVKTDISYGDKNLVAPGTEGKLTDMTLSGTPEVAVSVTYVATVKLTGWTINTSEDYFPIVFTLEDKTYGVAGNGTLDYEYADSAALAAGLKSAIEGLAKEYPVNTDLSTVATDAPTLTWAWAFEPAAGNTYHTNEKDTKLGDLATLPEISIIIETTVSQID